MAVSTPELNKLYMVGLVFPGVLNDPSSVRPPIHVSDQCLSVNIGSIVRNVQTVRRPIAVILRYDDTTKVAVILLGSAHPRLPHRFIPWFGTPRLQNQIRQVLHPSPEEAFVNWPGFLNFTHALRVLVIQDNEAVRMTTPGLAYCFETRQYGDVMDIFVPPGQIQLLHSLHARYWEGKRYSEDGQLLESGPASGPDDQRACNDDEESVVSVHEVTIPPPNEVTNPLHVRSGLPLSWRVALMFQEEDLQATQVEMLDEATQLRDMPTPSVCGIFKPLTTGMLESLTS